MKKVISILVIFSILMLNDIPCLALYQNPLSITKQEKILKSELKKQYAGYEYTITNNSSIHYNIINAQIINGTDGSIAYNQSKVSAGKSIDVLWAIMAPAGLFTLGIAWAVGIIGTPIAWLIGHGKNKKLRRESFIYSNSVPLGYIEPQENITVMTLILLGAKPQLKITIYDDISKEYQIVNY